MTIVDRPFGRAHVARLARPLDAAVACGRVDQPSRRIAGRSAGHRAVPQGGPLPSSSDTPIRSSRRPRRRTTSRRASGVRAAIRWPCSTTSARTRNGHASRPVRRWQRLKFDAGYAMINWPKALGGRGLPNSYLRGLQQRGVASSASPRAGELPPTSMGLIADHDRRLRHARAAAALHRPAHAPGHLRVPAVQRAVGRLATSPSLTTTRRARRRRVGAERAEGVDVRRPLRRRGASPSPAPTPTCRSTRA